VANRLSSSSSSSSSRRELLNQRVMLKRQLASGRSWGSRPLLLPLTAMHSHHQQQQLLLLLLLLFPKHLPVVCSPSTSATCLQKTLLLLIQRPSLQPLLQWIQRTRRALCRAG